MYLKLTVLPPACPFCILLLCIPLSFLFFTLPPLLQQVRSHISVTPGLENCVLKRLNANTSSLDFTGCVFNLAARVQGVLQQHKPILCPLHFCSALFTFCLSRNTASFSTAPQRKTMFFFSRDSSQTCFSRCDDQRSPSIKIPASLLLDQTNSS